MTKSADFYTPQELLAERVFPFGKNKLYEALERGEIPGSVKIGDRWLIAKRKVAELAGRVTD